MKRRFWCVLWLCGALVSPAFSEEKTLSLDETIAIALKNNPDILRSEKEIEAARARTLQLGAVPNPELVFSNEGIPFRSGRGEREFSLGLRQLIEFPGKRGLRRAIGQAGEKISEAALESERLLLVTRVKKAYLRAAYSEMALDHLHSILETVGEYQKMAAIRFEAGGASSIDVLRGRLEEVRVQNEIIEAKRRLQEDKASLWLEMGAETPATYPDLEELSFAPLTKGLEELRKAAGERPLLRALRQTLELRTTSVKLARKSLYPDLRMGLFYPSLHASGWGFELELSIPLWSKSTQGLVLESEALREQGAISLDYAARKITNRVETTYAAARAASDQVSLIEGSLLKDAADLLSAGITNYQYGRIDSLNLFDIYRMHKESRLEYLRALLNYHLSLAELEAAGEAPDA